MPDGGAQRLIYVCRSCDRNAPVPAAGASAGARIAGALREHLAAAEDGAAWGLREVACLSGCLRPCNVALRGYARYTYRFSRVTTADLPDLLAFARLYWSRDDGAATVEEIPVALQSKLTVHTPPRGRWA